MASLSAYRFAAGGIALRSCVARQLLARSGVESTAIVPRKNLALTPASKRHYGPEEENEKVDEVHHWRNERYVALALVPIIPTALIFPNVVCDTLLVSAMVLHSHWRLSGVVQDYIHGAVGKVMRPFVLVMSICAFGSLCYFNYTDIGFGNAVRLIYTQL